MKHETETFSPSKACRRAAAPIWQAQRRHPFVLGISDGTLVPEKFAVWLTQDYVYLIDYARLFALAAARAPDLATMQAFARLLHATLDEEMALHRSYVASFGLTAHDLERATKLPTTQGYTDFLLRTAALDDYAELLGALLPCMWGYSWLGQELLAAGLPAEERYARWIELYASPDFAELAVWCRDLLDRACAGLSAAEFRRVEAAFITSSRYELAFWDMAWRQEAWAGEGQGG